MMSQERQSSGEEDIIRQFPRLDEALTEGDKKAVREWVKNKVCR